MEIVVFIINRVLYRGSEKNGCEPNRKLKKRHNLHMYFASIIALGFLLYFINFFVNKEDYKTEEYVLQIVISIFLIVIIFLWLNEIEPFKERIVNLGNAFTDKKYKYAYMQHLTNIYFLPCKEKIEKCIGKFNEIEDEDKSEILGWINGKKIDGVPPYKLHKIYKAVYIIIWIAIIIYLSIVLFLNGWACSDIYHIHFKNINYIAVYNLLLFIISMILNMGSYFMSIAHLFFSKAISEITNLADWDYNKIIPSMTYGFRLLVEKMKDGATVFTTLAFMYTITYELILVLRENNDLAVDGYIQFSSGMIFFLGIGTAIFTVIIPYFTIKKMYNIWKEKELQSYDEKFKKNYMNNIQSIFEYKCLVDDRIRYDINTAITIALSAATLCLNILSLDIQIY